MLPLYDVIQKILKYKCWHYTWQFSIEKVNKTCMKIFWILKSFWICLITMLIIIYDWLNFTVTLINTNWKNWLLDNTFCNQKLCVSTICSVHLVIFSTVTHLHQDALNRDCLLFIWWNLGSCYNSVHLNCDV